MLENEISAQNVTEENATGVLYIPAFYHSLGNLQQIYSKIFHLQCVGGVTVRFPNPLAFSQAGTLSRCNMIERKRNIGILTFWDATTIKCLITYQLLNLFISPMTWSAL